MIITEYLEEFLHIRIEVSSHVKVILPSDGTLLKNMVFLRISCKTYRGVNVNLRVVKVLTLSTLLILLILPVIANAQAPIPPIKLKPNMRVTVYPDGSVGIDYTLDVTVKPSKALLIGDFMLGLTYRELEGGLRTVFSGVFDLYNGTLENLISTQTIDLKGKFKLKSFSINTSALIYGNAYLEVRSNSEVLHKLEIKSLTVKSQPHVAYVAFTITIKTVNETLIEILRNMSKVNATNMANEGLIKRNITFIKFKRLEVKEVDGAFDVNGELMINVEDILSQGVKQGVIGYEDVETIRTCLLAMYKDLDGSLRFVSTFRIINFTKGIRFTGKFEVELNLEGNIKGFKGYSRTCGIAMSKLGYLISTLTSGAKVGEMPTAPPTQVNLEAINEVISKMGIGKVRLEAVLPYRLDLLLRGKLTRDVYRFTLTLNAFRLKYPTRDEWKTVAKKGLEELSNFLQNVSRKLGFLELMGVGNPVPSSVEVYGGMLEGKSVGVKEAVVSIGALPYVTLELKTITTTYTLPRPPSLTVTISVIKTLTKELEKTVTTTKTLELTKTLTRTITKTLTTTSYITTTVVKPTITDTQLALIVAAILVMVFMLLMFKKK